MTKRNFVSLVAITAVLLANNAMADVRPVTLPKFASVMAVTPRPITDFTLTDQDGKARKFSIFRGQPTLVFFGFTNCPDVCPATMHQLQLVTAMRRPDMRGIKVLMISVDGERDTPLRLKEFLATISMPYLKIISGMTGSRAQVREIAKQFGAVSFKREPRSGEHSYSLDHSSQVYLVDGDGVLRAEFYAAALPQNIASVTDAVRRR